MFRFFIMLYTLSNTWPQLCYLLRSLCIYSRCKSLGLAEVPLFNFYLTPTLLKVGGDFFGRRNREYGIINQYVGKVFYFFSPFFRACSESSCYHLSEFSRWFFSVGEYIVLSFSYAFWLQCRDQFVLVRLWCISEEPAEDTGWKFIVTHKGECITWLQRL